MSRSTSTSKKVRSDNQSPCDTVSAAQAKRLLLHGAGLTANPQVRATPGRVLAMIRRLGYVQIDSINVLARAHHHILHSRFDEYQPQSLAKLHERDRSIFEHWTHDASLIPIEWFAHWKHRFDVFRQSDAAGRWIKSKLGDQSQRVLDTVRKRIADDGPLLSRDFEHRKRTDGENGWWNWKPAKAALEYMWRCGELTIAARKNFQKVYDLTERVHPEHHAAKATDAAAHADWACSEALDRIGVGTPSEIAAYLEAIPLADGRAWCRKAIEDGRVEEVLVESVDGSQPRRAFAPADWKARLRRTRPAPKRMRLLSPFDPLVRDRKRALRLFGFNYRFEAFVPEARRQYGYYVLPILDGEDLNGRVDMSLDRKTGRLTVENIWWEQQATRRADAGSRGDRFAAACDRFAALLEADDVRIGAKARRKLR